MTARLPKAALAARWTSVSWLPRRKRMGSSVSRPTGRTSFSVISANARAALRWRSTLSENERVVRAERGEPAKKLVAVRSGWMDLSCGTAKRWMATHSQGTEGDPRLPPAHSQAGGVRMIETSVNGLWGMLHAEVAADGRYSQHDSQQLATTPIVAERRGWRGVSEGRW